MIATVASPVRRSTGSVPSGVQPTTMALTEGTSPSPPTVPIGLDVSRRRPEAPWAARPVVTTAAGGFRSAGSLPSNRAAPRLVRRLMSRVSVLVCRDCCCGTARHPDVDHASQLKSLRGALPPDGRFWQVQCLGPCASSNVVVVRSGTGRRWFGRVLAEDDTAALASWVGAGAPEPLPGRLRELLIDPDDDGVELDPLDCSPAALEALVATALEARVGAWSMGVVGATAEWIPDATTTVEHSADGRLEAAGVEGSLSLRIGRDVRAFVARRRDGPVAQLLLAVPAEPVAHEVTDLGPDRSDRRLIDLGLGVGSCRFAVLADDALMAHLRPYLGARWDALLDAAGATIVAASPPRVLRTPLGRLEVRSPIPPPGGRSPDGSHTHLRAAELHLGRELPTGFALPAGLAPGVVFHPPVGWGPPDGWPG